MSRLTVVLTAILTGCNADTVRVITDSGTDIAPRDSGRPELAADRPPTGSSDSRSDASALDPAPPDASETSTRQKACSDYAASLCQKWGSCAPFYLRLWFGDAATCVQRMRPLCERQLASSGTSETASQRASCARGVAELDCARWLALETPAACVPTAGPLGNGRDCISSWQCQSTYCATDAGCGVCAPRAGVGGACTEDAGCHNGLVCSGVGQCSSPALLGQACGPTHPCQSGSTCAQGACLLRRGAGESCTGDECNDLEGQFCSASSSSCRAYGLAKRGEPCGWVAEDVWTVCTGDSYCQLESSTSGTGTCSATAAEGQRCDDGAGPLCSAPARCIAGRCRLSCD